MPNQVHLRALTNYRRLPDLDVVKKGITVCTNMTGNPKFSGAPVDLAVFKSNLDSLSTLISEAADGSKTVIAKKNQQRETVIGMLHLLARYVEIVSANDPAAFQTSGFPLASTTRASAAPLSERIRKIDHGTNSGQVLVWIQPVPKAGSYELHHGPAVNGGVPSTWATQPVLMAKSPVVLAGLMPGTTYYFQARALLKDGFTDWSDPVTFICT